MITDDYETNAALRNAHEIVAVDAYFKARPHLDNTLERKIFTEGFSRGWEDYRRRFDSFKTEITARHVVAEVDGENVTTPNIYTMKLHDVTGLPDGTRVTRVPNGWLYQFEIGVAFVPYSSEV